MASVIKTTKQTVNKKTGKPKTHNLYRVDFTHPYNSKRLTVRLGQVTKPQADEFASRIEDLIASKTSNKPDARVNDWLQEMGSDIHAKLVNWGLADARHDTSDVPLIAFVDQYTASRKDVKPRTKLNYKQARDFLEAFLTTELKQARTIKNFTKADAKAFRNWMLSQKNFKRNTDSHAENYVATQCKNLKLFFGAAVDARLIVENPFKDKLIPCKVQPVPGRMVFVKESDAATMLDHCPDIEWKVVIALARWGGLRIPSEIAGLKWEHINWETNRMVILQPKLKRTGKTQRVTPLFHQLYPILREAWEAYAEKSEYVLPRLRGEAKNLRTTLNKIIIRSGLVPWEKPFQNLRSTRATELADEFPLKTVSEWLGHDVQISLDHYQQVRETHWERAITGTIDKKSAAKSAAPTREAGVN